MGCAIIVGTIVVAGGAAAVDYVKQKKEEGRAKALNSAIEVTLAKTGNKNQTIIYRLGSGNATNLTPRQQDVTGLSYTTVKPTTYPFTVTSIEVINSTGKLVAVEDGPTHVSVRPRDSSKMNDWIRSRSTALTKPHEFTKILQSVSIKVA